MKELPKYFAIKADSKNPLWYKYIRWLNQNYVKRGELKGQNKNYFYGFGGVYNDDAMYFSKLSLFKHHPTLLSLEEWNDIVGDFTYTKRIEDLDQIIKATKKEEANMTRTINYTQGQQIIDSACEDWKNKLANIWGVKIALKTDILISENFYKEMRQACTSHQNKLFDSIFGVDSNEIDLSQDKVDERDVFNYYGNQDNSMITVRKAGEFAQKAFVLSYKYNWELKPDNYGVLCLIPTRIK